MTEVWLIEYCPKQHLFFKAKAKEICEINRSLMDRRKRPDFYPVGYAYSESEADKVLTLLKRRADDSRPLTDHRIGNQNKKSEVWIQEELPLGINRNPLISLKELKEKYGADSIYDQFEYSKITICDPDGESTYLVIRDLQGEIVERRLLKITQSKTDPEQENQRKNSTFLLTQASAKDGDL